MTTLYAETQNWRKEVIHFTKYFEILPKVILKFNSIDDFQHVLRALSDLGVMAASIFLKSEKSALESLQTLEKTRGIIFNLMINSRFDVSLLKNCHPEL